MELEIKEQKPKPLLGREQVIAEIKFQGATPTTEEIKKKIAQKLKKEENLIIVEKIKTKFGEQVAKVKANVYEKEEDIAKTEPEHIKKKNISKKENPAEEKSEEKPAEEAAKEGE